MNSKISAVLFLAVVGCAFSHLQSSNDSTGPTPPTPWQTEWTAFVGKTVTVEGHVGLAVLGPIVTSGRDDQHPFYIMGHDRWPDDCYDQHGHPKLVRVTGTVIKRTDIPAYEHLIDLPDPTNPRAWRFLLKDAKWVVLD
jgi:hypothetical protein